MIGEFVYGIRTLLRGFGTWRRRPGLMALGLVPGLIAALVLLAGLVPLALSLAPISDAVTPFADGWIPAWRSVFRAAVGIVIFATALALASAVFSALALTIGDPFYQRIWRAVETDLGDAPPSDGGGFWMAVGEGLRLVVLGILIALLVLLLGLVPLVGGALGAVGGVVLSGRMLARELTGRAFDARELTPADRAVLFRGSRARVLGFGVATQLCFLIPGGAVAVMPAAVAGATTLARTMLERTPLPQTPLPQTPPPSAQPGPPAPPARPAPPAPPAPGSVSAPLPPPAGSGHA
ncbi:EI24 domain-containing protein [Microbacterium sp. APC 3901]|uniref:EI24 domain-containing protein n=1 Tax=Microbacterium sp. APC 3901 TaxID=3035192 RepID=UPI0025B36FFF|nr:EI24 domain-containing protein [Microbacterium sp. APC 3901]MDN3442720.1 EI24 domain-containing protein [Microbacterium sp. APC 3901]